MSKISTHCEDCLNILGKEYREVHAWLDAYTKIHNPFFKFEYHRKFRHHAEGVKEIGRKWGHYAEKAAKIHIIGDMNMYVYCNMNTLTEDKIDECYEKALKFCDPIPNNNKWKTDDELLQKKQVKKSSKR